MHRASQHPICKVGSQSHSRKSSYPLAWALPVPGAINIVTEEAVDRSDMPFQAVHLRLKYFSFQWHMRALTAAALRRELLMLVTCLVVMSPRHGALFAIHTPHDTRSN